MLPALGQSICLESQPQDSVSEMVPQNTHNHLLSYWGSRHTFERHCPRILFLERILEISEFTLSTL